jgi:chaperonin cofactor prefoldin
MSFLKPTLRERKERLQHKIDSLKNKIKHTERYDQKKAMEHKLYAMIIEKHNLWKNYVIGGRK